MKQPIGIFDSGIGGLTVAKSITEYLPKEDILFLGDHANVPYGEKTLDELITITETAVPTLITEGAKVIIIACNTVSVSMIDRLRKKYPDTPFVAVVPMVKTAAETTKSKVVAVFATQLTLRSPVYDELKRAYAQGITVLDFPCPEWVRMIESGQIDDARVRAPIDAALSKRADRLVMGCTHFPFLMERIQTIAGTRAEVLESGPAIARQVERILTSNENIAAEGPGRITYLTSADHQLPDDIASQLTGWNVHFQTVGH
jgi:glutamate racemase